MAYRKKPRIPLGLKFFSVTFVVLALTIYILATQNSREVAKVFQANFQLTAMTAGESIAYEIKSYLDTLGEHTAVTTRNIIVTKKKNLATDIQQLQAKIPEISYFGISRFHDNSYEIISQFSAQASSPPPILASAPWLKLLASTKQEKIIAQTADGSSFILARRFRVRAANTVFWASIVVPKTALKAIFQAPQNISVLLATSTFTPIIGSDTQAQDISFIKNPSALSKSIKAGLTEGYLGDLQDRQQKSWLVSYNKIPNYELLILIKQDAAAISSHIAKLLTVTFLKAMVIFLIAVAFSLMLVQGVTHKLKAVIHMTQKIAAGMFDFKMRVNSNDEVADLVGSVNAMSHKIKNLLLSEIEKTRLQAEMDTAHTVQEAYYPAKDEYNQALVIAGYHIPSSECCGDWWGRMRIAPGVEQVIIADATGHGAPAALITAMIYSTVSTLMELGVAEGRTYSPAEIMKVLNQVIHKSLAGRMLATCIIMQFDSNNKTLTFANAGHCHPYLILPGTQDERFPDFDGKNPIKTILDKAKLSEGPAGIVADQNFQNVVIPLKTGDRFFVYSDGAVEFKTNKNKQFGTRGLRQTLKRFAHEDTETFRNHVAASIQKEIDQGEADDDFTFVVIDHDRNQQQESAA